MKKIFISHSSEDTEYVEQIVNLLIGMGLDREQFFCTSLDGYGIPTDTGIIDYLREQRSCCELHVIFVHSNNYHNSTECLIEMGAAQALLSEETSILLPDVNSEEMVRTVNTESLIKLCRADEYIKDRLNVFYDKIVTDFALERNDDCTWEHSRDSFIKEVELIWFERIQLSRDAVTLLDVFTDYQPVYIINEQNPPYGLFRPNEDVEVLNVGFDGNETDRWNSALEELLEIGFVKQFRNEPKYRLTYSGHQYWNMKWADIILFRMTYDEYVDFLKFKYSKVPGDYYLNENCSIENPNIKRSGDALIIHHIDEDKIPGLSNMPLNRMRYISYDYQRADRLVYCHYVEHTILHMKIIEKELTRDINERNSTIPVGILGFSKMVADINYRYTDGNGKQVRCPQQNTMDTYRHSFVGPWTSRVAKIIKYFIENIVIRNDFQEWYGEWGNFEEWPGCWENLGDFLTFIHQIYVSNPIEFNETIDMEHFIGVYGVTL